MRILTSGTLTVEAYDAAVWKQERNVLRVTDPNATNAGLYVPNLGIQLAQYTLDENHSVIIDMTDYIRAHAYATDVWIRTDGGAAQYVNANYNIVGLINPENVIVPDNINRDRLLKYTEAWGYFYNVIVPPQRMLKDIGTEGTRIVCEFYPDDMINPTPLTYLWGLSDDYRDADGVKPTMTVNLGANDIRTWTDEAPGIGTATIQKVHLQPLECDKRYAAVRWVSFTGQTRLHTFEVVQSKTETDGAFELLTQDGAFNVVKGRKDGFALRLDGLNDYDLWYYSDVCHSGRVEVSFDGIEWQRVNVTTNSVTSPDGNAGKTNTLLIELIYKKYDAVSM